ncbi:hypothetical protein EPN87_01570 [archaeon]|nr:MAG: hypothetical protein EPN87_01570 [archaeon]
MKTTAVFLVAFLALSSVAIADNSVNVTLSSSNIILKSGDTQSINITVTNNQATDDTFSLSIFPSYLQGITTSLTHSSLFIKGASQGTATLYFSAPFDVDQFVSIFSVTARSFSNQNIQASKDILLQSVRRSPVYVSDIKLSSYSINPLETITINTKLTNLDSREYNNYVLTTFVKSGDNILERFDTNVSKVGPKSSVDVTNSYDVAKYAAPRDYIVQSLLKDSLGALLSASDVHYKVNAIYKLPEQYTKKTTSIGFVSATTTVTVMNDGNVASPGFYVTESVLGIAEKLFSSTPSPTYTNSTLGNIVYSWYIPPLQPGQSVIIEYRISLIPIWITLVGILIAVYIAFVYTFQPAVVKSHRHYGRLAKEREIPVIIDVKNKSIHEIKDIVVVDHVPQLAQLVDKFDTLKPRVKKTADGVQLVWKFDSLKPREERVMTYRIKPLLDASELHLPHARASYSNRKKQKKLISSRKIVVK